MVTRTITAKLQRFFPAQFDLEIQASVWRYSIALLAVAAALSITLLLDPLLRGTPAALFFVAVMISSWLGGFGAGLFATLLSTVALNYFFLEPLYSLDLANLRAVFQLSVFAIAAILISSLNEAQRSAKKRADANLKAWRDSEAQFAHLSEANIIGIFQADRNGSITEANDTFLQMLGYTREDLLSGRIRWNEIVPPEYQEATQRSEWNQCSHAQQERCTTDVCTPFETEYIRKDGARVPMLLGSVTRDEQTVIGFVLDRGEFKRNEAERQQAEAALREREQRLDLATSAANLGVFEWNIQTDYAVWENARMYEIFGRTLAEGTLNKVEFINNVIHPEDREAFELKLAESMMQNSSFQGVCRIRRHDKGQWCWAEFSGQFDLAPDGTPLRLIGVIGDISDRKQAEAEREQLLHRLETSLGQLEAVINHMAEGLVVADPQGNILTFNPAALAIHGYDSLEQVQRHLHKFPETIEVHDLQGSFVPMEQWPIARALQGETFSNCEIQAHRRDIGRTFIGNYGGTPVRDKQGQVILAIVTLRDVTQQRHAQAELARSLVAEQTAREEAERANRIKDEFLAVLSHELRSPLNPILGWTKLMQSQKFSPERAAQALATIERNAKLQAQLIEDLLDVSRILQGKMVLNISSVNLATTIEAAIETVHLAAEAKNIEIHTALNDNESVVSGDAARLQQIVWNLLTNAVKFTPQGGRVEVRLDHCDRFAQIQVQDTGKGISPDFLPYVFDYFRQEDGATTRKFGGLGLGLALVQHLTEQHGGTVRAESAGEGQGATFTVRLPLQSFPSATDLERFPTTSTADLHNVNILVVDDEADTRDLMLTILEAQGAQVKVVASATEALTILAQWQPDVLISDIGMPEIDGYMLMRQVRLFEASQRELPSAQPGGRIPAISAKRNCVAIALTAYAGELDQQQALSAGFQQHLAKPIEPDKLIEAIVNLLDRLR